jgi:hypothetical protein
MKRLLILTSTLLFAGQLHAACDYPSRAKMVDGASATKEEMLETQASVKAFKTAMEAYLKCLDTEEKAEVAELDDPSEEELAGRTEALNKKYNAAVEELEIVAAEFNEQVRLFKAQSE